MCSGRMASEEGEEKEEDCKDGTAPDADEEPVHDPDEETMLGNASGGSQ